MNSFIAFFEMITESVQKIIKKILILHPPPPFAKKSSCSFHSQNPEVSVVSHHDETEAEDADTAQESAGCAGGKLWEEGIGEDVEEEVGD